MTNICDIYIFACLKHTHNRTFPSVSFEIQLVLHKDAVIARTETTQNMLRFLDILTLLQRYDKLNNCK